MGAGPATGSRPLRRDAESNRRRILDAAGRIMSERGLAVPMEEIAAAAGVGVGTLYRRFSSRQAIIEALFEDRMAAIVADAEAGLTFDDGWDGLVWYLEHALARQVHDRALGELIHGDAGRGRVAAMRDRMRPVAEQLVERAQASGRLRPDFTITDLAMLQVMVTAAAVTINEVDPEGWSRYLGMALDGLRRERSEPSPLSQPPLSLDDLERALITSAPPGPAAPRRQPAPPLATR